MMCRNLSAVQSYVFWMPLLPTKHSCTTQFKTIQTRQELFSAALVMNSEEVILWCNPSLTCSMVSCLQSSLCTLTLYRKQVVPDQQATIAIQKPEADLTDEQRKKVGISLGRLEG